MNLPAPILPKSTYTSETGHSELLLPLLTTWFKPIRLQVPFMAMTKSKVAMKSVLQASIPLVSIAMAPNSGSMKTGAPSSREASKGAPLLHAARPLRWPPLELFQERRSLNGTHPRRSTLRGDCIPRGVASRWPRT